MNRFAHTGRILLAALTLIASIGIMASPAGAMPPSSNGGTDPTTTQGVAVNGNVMFASTDGQPIYVFGGGGGTYITPGGGQMTHTITGNGTLTLTINYTYTPTASFTGTDSFDFYASDAMDAGTIETETVTVTAAANTAPTAAPFSVTTAEDTARAIALSSYASDPDGDALTYSITGAASRGTATVTDPATGAATYTPNANLNGGDTFTYQVCDPSNACAAALASVTVTAADDSPTWNTPTHTVREGSTVSGTVVFNDVDTVFSSGGTGQPTNGTITSTTTGQATNTMTVAYTYTPTPGYTGPDSFVVLWSQGVTLTGPTVNITVTDNNAPVATAATATTAEDATLAGTLTAFDGDGDTLTYALETGGANGTATVDANGTYTYVPNANWNGTDTFTFTASDDLATSAPATVTVTVTPVADNPVITVDASSFTIDNTQTATVTGTVTDPDGDSTNFNGVEPYVTNGSLGGYASAADFSITYAPAAGFVGTDSFGINYVDGGGAQTTQMITISVAAAPNTAPVAAAGTADVNQDGSVTGAMSGTDADGDTLTYTVTAGPANGTLSGVNASTGAYTYTPDAGFYGTDTFSFTVNDGTVDSAAATITIDVNATPVASDTTPTVAEDTDAQVALRDSTADPDDAVSQLTYTLISGPDNGTIVDDAPEDPTQGTYTYRPDPDFNGTDSITYQACDADGACDTGTVTFTITAVNDTPVATTGGVIGDEDTDITGFVTGTDVDGDTLTYAATTDPAFGTVVVNADGTYTYTPGTDFTGTDSFDFEACDPDGACGTGTLTITVNPVNDAPVATSGAVTGTEDTDITGFVTGTDVDDDTAELTFAATTDPGFGQVTVNTDGTYTYTPGTDFAGTDSFDFEACDPDGACGTGTLTINVTAVNDAPVTADDTATTAEDTAVGGLTPVTDVDDTTHTFTVTGAATNGAVGVDAATGEWAYTPEADFTGDDSFTIEVCDAEPLCDSSTVAVTVTAVNDGPVATDATVTTAEDTAVTGTVEVTDIDDTAFTFAVTVPATHGTATVDATTGAWSYTPGGNFNGTDTFTIEVCDTDALCDTAIVNVTVTATNDAPVATGATLTVDEDTAGTVTVTASDADGDTLTATISDGPANGTATVDGLTVTYTPDSDFNGTDTMTVTVCDPSGACDTATITITVTAVNDAPTSVADTDAAGADQTVTVGTRVILTAGDSSDVDGDELVHYWTQTGGPDVTLVVMAAADGDPVVGRVVSFTPDEAGTYTFQLRTCDTDGLCDTDTVDVTVLAAQVTPGPTPTPTPTPGPTPTPAPVPTATPTATPGSASTGRLPNTGATSGPLAAAAALMIAAGVALTATSRRRTQR